MKEKQEYKRLKIIIASYNEKALQANAAFFSRLKVFETVETITSGEELLMRLKKGMACDIILLDDQLLDTSAAKFARKFWTTDACRHSLLFLMCSRYQMSNTEPFSPFGGLYHSLETPYSTFSLIRQLQEAVNQSNAIQRFFSELYRSWGQYQREVGQEYLVEAVEIALGSDKKLALRKEMFAIIGDRRGISVGAVDSGIRRTVEHIEKANTEKWRQFKAENGLDLHKPRSGEVIYTIRELFLRLEYTKSKEG